MKLQQTLCKLPKVISSRSGRKLPCTLQHVCDLYEDRHFILPCADRISFDSFGLANVIER